MSDNVRSDKAKSDAKTTTGQKSRARKFIWGVLKWFVIGVVCVVVAGLLSLWYAIGRDVEAPNWVRNSITNRISAQLPTLNIDFDELSVKIPKSLSPILSVKGLRLSLENGTPIASMAQLEADLSRQAMLQGTVEPKTISLSGSRVAIRKEIDGRFTISGDEIGGTKQTAVNLIALFDTIDPILKRPSFSRLRRIEANDFRMYFEDAALEQSWNADDGKAVLVRDGDDFELSAVIALLSQRDYATTIEASYNGSIETSEGAFGVNLTDIPTSELAVQTPALHWLSIVDASVSGAFRGSITPDGQWGPINASLTSADGKISPTQSGRSFEFNSAGAYLTYVPESRFISIEGLNIQSPWIEALAEGKGRWAGAEPGTLAEMLAQLHFSKLKLNPFSVYDEPVVFDQAEISAKLNFDPLHIEIGEFNIGYQDHALVGNGVVSSQQDGLDVAIDGRMDKLNPDILLALWPKSVKVLIRRWIEQNIKTANLDDVVAALRVKPKTKPNFALEFGFDNLETTFVRGFLPIKGGSGNASLYNDRFVVMASEGRLDAPKGGPVNIAGTTFIIPDTTIKEAPAEVDIHANGTLTGILALLDAHPFNFLKKAGRTIDIATGQGVASGKLTLPLKNKPLPTDIHFDIAGKMRNVKSDRLVPGRVLTAKALSLRAKTDQIQISGDVRIGAVPASVKWQAGMGRKKDGTSRVDGTVTLSQAFMDEFKIGLPPGTISGQGAGKVRLNFAQNGPTRFELNSNLAGLGVNLPELGWGLSKSATGSLTVSGTLGTPPRVDNVSLSGPGFSAKGKVSIAPSGGLKLASFSMVKVGKWFNSPIDLVGRGVNIPPAIRVRGGGLDLRNAKFGQRKGRGGGGSTAKQEVPLDIRLDRLQITDQITITDFRGKLIQQSGLSGDFTGSINGKAAIKGRVKPHNGRSAVMVQSNNAGRAIAAAKLVQNAREGTLELSMLPTKKPGGYNGDLHIRNVRIKDVPWLASLLNAISVVGILNQLNGEGIHFSDLVAKFQLTPDLLTLSEASAVGASMGLSADGYYYPKAKKFDIQGVISPIYMVNAIGQIFSRRGEGLIGFNYTLTGPADKPKVGVNPLSMFTPGMFRDIFRRPPPKVTE